MSIDSATIAMIVLATVRSPVDSCLARSKYPGKVNDIKTLTI
jgi:hypothetical protein